MLNRNNVIMEFKMKFKILCLSLALAGLPWFTLTAGAQLTVNTVPTTGLDEPSGLVQDAQGNYYLADSANNCIVRIDGSTLAESVLAGTGARALPTARAFPQRSTILKACSWWAPMTPRGRLLQ